MSAAVPSWRASQNSSPLAPSYSSLSDIDNPSENNLEETSFSGDGSSLKKVLSIPNLSSMCARVICRRKSVFPQPGYIQRRMQSPPRQLSGKQLETPPSSSHEHSVKLETPMASPSPEHPMKLETPSPTASFFDEFPSAQRCKHSDRHHIYRKCPIPRCHAKPQKRIADHIRLCHQSITPRKRKQFCRIAKRVPRKSITQSTGQRKLLFKEPKKAVELVAPVFENFPEARPTNRESIALALQPGKKGSTRNIGSFPAEHPKLVDFRRYLMSVDGSQKSHNVAKEISSDISKILYHADPTCIGWKNLTNRKGLLTYFEWLSSIDVGSSGRLTKMERCGDGFKYMRFCLHNGKKGPEEMALLSDIDAAEGTLGQWKTVLRRDKKRLNTLRLERDSNELPGLEVVSRVVDNADLENMFENVLEEVKHGSVDEEKLKLAVATVAIPAMLQSAARAGAVINVTLTEFEEGMEEDGVFVVSVTNHKTNIQGTCKLMFDAKLLARTNLYLEYIRPALGAEKVPNLFVLPNAKPIQKISNLSRLLEAKLKFPVPSSTKVRKISTTAVARNCSKETLSLVSKQLNHDAQTSATYYECVRARKDASDMYKTVAKLRAKDTAAAVTAEGSEESDSDILSKV